MVYFWKEKISLQLMKEYLSCEEYQEYERISEQKKDDWIAGRIASKKLIADMIRTREGKEMALKNIEIMSTSQTRPNFRVLENNFPTSEYSLSISHARGIAIAGLSRIKEKGYIGVDIEYDRKCTESFARSFLSEREFCFCYTHQIPFLQMWCYKEAFLKALGEGLRVHPHTVEVYTDEKGEFLRLTWNGKKQNISSEQGYFDQNLFGAILYVQQ